jgi:hypothetical protein
MARALPRGLQARGHTNRSHCTYLSGPFSFTQGGCQNERTDGILSVLDCLEDNGTRALGTSIYANIDVGTNDIASCAEQVFEVLPAGLVW